MSAIEPECDSADEILIYLHSQIDPRDQLNPRYALLWKQIEAIIKAKSTILATQPMGPILIPVGAFLPAPRTTS
jgi:hypothetical protein